MRGLSLPVAFEIVHKDLLFCEVDTRQVKRQSAVTKNEHLCAMLGACRQNQVRYRYVLTDNSRSGPSYTSKPCKPASLSFRGSARNIS